MIALIEFECNTSVPIHTSIREKIIQAIRSTLYNDIDNSAMLVGLYELSENIRNTTAVYCKQLEVLIHSSIETTEPRHVTLTAGIRITLEKLTVAGYHKRPRLGSYKSRSTLPSLSWVRKKNQSTSLYPICLTFALELSLHLCLYFPSDLYRPVSPTEAVYEFLILCMCAT